MVDLPAGQERPLELERAPFVVAAEEEEPLPGSDQQQDAHEDDPNYFRSARISPAARWPVSTAPFR